MLHDIQYAVRSLRRQPGFALLVIAVLAIGIGSATAIANVYTSVLLRRLPVREQDRLVAMWGAHRARQFDRVPFSARGVRLYQEQNRSLEAVATTDYNGAYARLFRTNGEPMELHGIAVSGNFFEVLGAPVQLGRALRAEDDVEGGPGHVVISHGAWVHRFGGDPAVIGRPLQLVSTGAVFTIVGVMPAGFEYPRGAELWGTRAVMTPSESVHLVGRLRSSTTLESARRELTAFFAQEPSPLLRGADGVAKTLPDLLTGDVRPALRVLAMAVALLLLVSCVNVANLFLIRGVERSREFAVRSALGAGRARLVRQLLMESGVVAVIAGIAGLGLALGAQRILVAVAPAELPRLDEIRSGGSVVWAAITTAVTAVLFGVAPALWSAGPRATAFLRSAWRSVSEGRTERLIRDILVTGQLALAILIVTSAGLVTRSLLRLQRVDVGFATERVLVAQLGWPGDQSRDAAWGIALHGRLADALEQTPGVIGTAPLVAQPFSGTGGWDGLFVVEGRDEMDHPILNMEVASPRSFVAMGIGLRTGRAFDDRDRSSAERVVIVSETAARRLWPDTPAEGKRMKLGTRATDWWTVVGVVADTRYREFATSRPTVYFPLGQLPFPFPPSLIAVRTAMEPAEMARTLRRVVASVDANVMVARTSTMTALLDEPLAQPRLNALLLGAFAGVVMVLAAVGLYGVLARTVRQRTRELGIRLALGARPSQLHSLVVRRGMLIALIGAAIGVVAAMFAARFLRALLYEISPTDPATIIGSSAFLLVIALAACLAPARRATRVDPLVALRAE